MHEQANTGIAEELSSRVLIPALSMVRRRLGDEAIDELLKGSGIDRVRALDPSEWISLASANHIYGRLGDLLGEPEAPYLAGLDFVRRESIGAVYYLARALGSPALFYDSFTTMSEEFSRITRWHMLGHGAGWVRISFELDAGHTDTVEYCAHRQGILTGVPTLWGLPEAQLTHPICRVRGEGPDCIYEVRWVPRGRLTRALALAALVALLGGGVAVAVGQPASILLPAAVLAGAWLMAALALTARASRQAVSWTGEQLVELRRQYAAKLEAVEDLRILRRMDEATRHGLDGGALLARSVEILSERRRFDVVTTLDSQADAQELEALGLQSWLVAPLEGVVSGQDALLAGSRDRDLTVADEQLLKQAARTVSLALEAGRSLERLDGLVRERTAQLEAATDSLVSQARMASVGQLVDGLVHEIKNPLNFTRNGTQAIERRLAELGVEDEGVAKAARIVRTGSDRILEVVDALGGLSRSAGGQAVAFKLQEAVHDTLTLVEADLRQAGVEIEVEISGGSEVVCRPGEIRQVILNLVTNAGQALQPVGGGRIRIEVTGEPEQVRLTVADDGPGVPEDVRDRIFDPYFTTKDPEAGTGLGLSVAARIAGAHRGTLRLVEGPGSGVQGEASGATFELILPR